MNALYVTPFEAQTISHNIIAVCHMYGIWFNNRDVVLIKKCRFDPNLVDQYISIRRWNELVIKSIEEMN